MKTVITDPEVLSALDPNVIASYLRTHGWQQTGKWGDKATIWGLNGDIETEVIIPNSHQYSDFARRVAEILTVLAKVEHRPKIEVYNDLVTSKLREDVVRLRALHPEAGDGTIPLKDAAKLYDGAFRLVEAAAAVVEQKRPYLPSRKSAEVIQYLKNTRIGPSERGSYVMVVHSPIDVAIPRENTSQSDPEDEPAFGRRVMTTLVEALTTLNTIADKIDPMLAGENEIEAKLGDFVEQGGTAELCDAVQRLHESARDQRVEINFSWSESLPVPSSLPNSIVLDSKLTPITQRFQRTLRRQQQQAEITVQGRIIGFKDNGTEGDSISAIVTIIAKVNRSNRHIRIALRDEEDRLLCIQALKQRSRIICTGHFVQISNYNILEDYHDLQIEDTKIM
jgi:hypothetical protein